MLVSTGHERVDIQTVLINAVRQLERLIAVFGLKGNLYPNQAVQRAAAFPRLRFPKWGITNLFISFPD